MTQFARHETGVPGLDELLMGGLPRARSTLITGKSGAGKTLLSLQIACRQAREGRRTLFVSIEEPATDLITSGETLGFETRALVESGMLRITDLSSPLRGPILVSGSFDISGLLHRLEYLVDSHRSEFIVLDSTSALFSEVHGHSSLRHQYFQLLHWFIGREQTAILTSEAPSDYDQISRLGVEDYLCDVVVQLRNVIDKNRRRRTIEVHKYRRSNHLKGEYPFALTTTGMSVFPLDALDEQLREGSDTVERYSSGIAGLNEMTRGGWLRDSITLVRGPTGSGKTILAGSFATAGAARGERVFYYGFEETETILVRNFERIGLPAKQLVEEGNLWITARFPESTSPEDTVVELRSVLTEYQPSLIVIDSISAIEHVLSYESFRQFMIGITAALRQSGRSALLTQAVARNHPGSDLAPYLSTLADSIVELGYSWEGGAAMQRMLRIVKMRGSAHDTQARTAEIDVGGLRVVPA